MPPARLARAAAAALAALCAAVRADNPYVTNPLVGTALAPTTPGGTCLNPTDYGAWTSTYVINSTKQTGYDIWPTDLQTCTEYCVAAPGNCGVSSSFLGTCFSTGTCVTYCMMQNSTLQPNIPTILGPVYTYPCAQCMGNVTMCVIAKCVVPCAQGKTSVGCQNCTISICDPAFSICSGLNPLPKYIPPAQDPVVVLVAVLVPSVIILLLCVYCGWLRYQRNLAKQQMNFQDLAKLAGASPMTGAPGPTASSNPGYLASPPPGAYPQMGYASPQMGYAPPQMGYAPPQYGQKSPMMMQPGMSQQRAPGSSQQAMLTPYQMEYQRQQAALAQGMPIQSQRYAPPSMRMSQLVQAPPPLNVSQATKLVVKFDFVGENSDELTVNMGTRLLGLEEADDWWLAKVVDTEVIGLIPCVFVDVEGPGGSLISKPGGSVMSASVAPQF